MPSETQSQTSKAKLWVSYIVSAIPVLFLVSSGIAKLVQPAPVLQGFAQIGFAQSLVVRLGILELICTAVYLIPRTSVLGAILLTGYLGGATVTHLRVSDPKFVAPVILGVFLWGGLFFRESRLRALIPLKRD
jgi:hypothetical protein